MSTTTPNLGLFKYNTSTDGKEVFSIQTALNNNWDIIDNMDPLPDQTGKDGYLLTTNGTAASWGPTGEIYPVVETYKSGTSWYRIYSDGWCEQGGRYSIATTGTGTITFLQTFRDTNYSIFNCKTSSDSSTWNVMFGTITDWTTTSVVIKANLTGYTLGGCWFACGYIEV